MFKRREGSHVGNIIGLHGKAGCGKNYIGENIVSPYGFRPWAFAWALKNDIIAKGLASYEDVYHSKNPAVRKLMQEEGTERGRDVFGEDIWVLKSLAWMEVFASFWGIRNFVITDARFENEIQMIHDLGGKVYHIDAPSRTDTALTDEAKKHRSETALDGFTGFDGYINNDVGRTDVAEQVFSLLRRDGFSAAQPEQAHDNALDRRFIYR